MRYQQITSEERHTLAALRRQHRSCAEIADILGRHRSTIHRELKRKHVTLTMLWDEYIERHPDGYRYSRFCELYRGCRSECGKPHAGGDKLFVDYCIS